MNRGALYYMMLPLIVAACLLQATAASRIKIYGVKPDLVLMLVVIGTLVYGGRAGLVWAFFGGLGLDMADSALQMTPIAKGRKSPTSKGEPSHRASGSPPGSSSSSRVRP